jgi:diaminopropionate ammonia-lyase
MPKSTADRFIAGKSAKRFVLNLSAKSPEYQDCIFREEELDAVPAFFRNYPAYSLSPLRNLDSYAKQLGIEALWIKDEYIRLGVNSFKILGVVYALHRLLSDGNISERSVLVCATDGNHGRALAHIGRQLSLETRIYVPRAMRQLRRSAIESEGAKVVTVDGSYDDAVIQAASYAKASGGVIVSDTGWPGYDVIPRYIMAGYTMLLAEAAAQWPEPPDVVFVQAGAGGLAFAVISWFYRRLGAKCPLIVSCEPINAGCVLESIRVGRPVILKGSLETIMAGLSCGTVSSAAWLGLRFGLDVCLTITDDECAEAVRHLSAPSGHDPVVIAGESGACGVAALKAVLCLEEFRSVREYLNLSPQSRVLAINTEGATDPEAYESITGFLLNR